MLIRVGWVAVVGPGPDRSGTQVKQAGDRHAIGMRRFQHHTKPSVFITPHIQVKFMVSLPSVVIVCCMPLPSLEYIVIYVNQSLSWNSAYSFALQKIASSFCVCCIEKLTIHSKIIVKASSYSWQLFVGPGCRPAQNQITDDVARLCSRCNKVCQTRRTITIKPNPDSALP